MNYELLVARKMIFGNKKSISEKSTIRPIIRIAITGIALGITIMLLAVAIVVGFQSEIRSKVIGFGSHITITGFDYYNPVESQPISKQQAFYPFLDTIKGVRHIQVYATKAGIIKTKEEIQGVIVKGIDSDFDWSFFQQNLEEGIPFPISDSVVSNKVIISRNIAKKLKLKLGDKLVMYFIQKPPRVRKFEVAGIFHTGLEQLDMTYILADIKHIQKLNDWEKTQISGFEVLLNSYDDLENMDDLIYNHIPSDLNTTTITRQFMEIFGWLNLLDMNVILIIVLMILVAGINMISALLILILERTQMVGTLKAMGATNWSIRKIFLYNGIYLLLKGLLWGNAIGISLCLLQYYFGIITLPLEAYYVSVVPIHLSLYNVLLLNSGTFVVCLLMLILPSYIITKISPVKAIRFN